MTLQEVNAALSIAKNLKDFFPFVGQLLKQTDESAFDVWRQTPVRRLEQLQLKIKALTDEYPGLQNRLTEDEKHSPISGVNKTFYEYAFAVDENKLEYLRNALLNGSYGDYTLEIREDLYRIVQLLQPLDVLVLRYLVEQCPNLLHAESLLQGTDTNKGVQEFESLRQMTSFNSITTKFKEVSQEQLRRSLDRLRSQALVFNPAPGFDFHNPYDASMPTEIAKILLNFIADPRNGLQK